MDEPASPPPLKLGFYEFVVLIAAIMALNALAVDAMLPALPQMGADLGVHAENDRQWIITAYLLGLGVAQLIYGPLADRYGRKPVLLVSLFFYMAFSIAAAFAGSFALMIAARALQGASAAAGRVVAISIVRDCYAGRQMARVMSLAFIVFMAVPILAPSLGQLILLVAPWRWIFGAFAILGGAVMLWSAIRLPETLHPEYRMAITPMRLVIATGVVLSERMSLGYTVALTFLVGGLFGFINSAQQIFFDVFNMPDRFPLVFAAVAASMAAASFVNSRIVERLGTRRVSHWALIGFVAVACTHFTVAATGHETIWSFLLLQAAMMSCFGLASANFGSMAMERVGEIAGTASSIQGFITTVGGSLLGILIGQQFDGTVVPITMGFSVLGALALLTVLITEQGRLFQARHAPPQA